MSDLQKDYGDLQKKFDLPSFKEIDSEFELSSLEEYEFLIREIRNLVAEPINLTTEVLEPILQPEPTMTQMYESSIFSESEKRKMFKIFKKLMLFKRRCTKLKIINDDKMDATFIKDVSVSMKEIKKELLPYLEKLEQGWEKEPTAEEKLPYMG